MSPSIMSRWYRAPEVILTSNYDQSIDIFSLGLMLVEIIYCSTEQANLNSKNRYLFQGKYCFPISPKENEKSIDENDQLVKLMERFDIESKMDFSFASSDLETKYL